MALRDTRSLYPGCEVACVSLGAATLRPGAAAELLRAAADLGVRLADTADSYGASEALLGAHGQSLHVASKFGGDFSASRCTAAAAEAVARLRRRRIALYQLHSPPDDFAYDVALVETLGRLVAGGVVGAWGASVESYAAGAAAVAAGARCLQAPFNALDQSLAPLLAACAARGVGVLARSALARGWLTARGVAAARLGLLHESAPRALFERVVAVAAVAEGCGVRVEHLALRFAAHATGVTSALVQAHDARGLADLVAGAGLDEPLPESARAALVALGTSPGDRAHGGAARVWDWAGPTPRDVLEELHATGALRSAGGAARRFYDAGGRYAPHEARWRRDFATRGVAGPFRGAFPRDVASALAAAAVAEPGRPQASYFHRDVAAPLAAGAFPGDLEAALAAILDDATCCRRATPPFAVDNFADAWPSRSGRAEKAFAANVVAHARATPGVAAWRCPSGREAVATGLSPWGLGVANGHHVDHGPHGAAWDFALEDQLLAPWCVVYVLLTDVARDQGPTVAWPGSQRVMANILAGLGPWRRVLLDTPRMYALCAAADLYFGDADATTLVGAAGDAFLVHPLLLHTASASTRRAPRAILNLPYPARPRRTAKGSLSALDLPIRDALRGGGCCGPLVVPLVAWTAAFGALHQRCRARFPRLAWLLYWPAALGFALLCRCAAPAARQAPRPRRAWGWLGRRGRRPSPAPDAEVGGSGYDDDTPLLQRGGGDP